MTTKHLSENTGGGPQAWGWEQPQCRGQAGLAPFIDALHPILQAHAARLGQGLEGALPEHAGDFRGAGIPAPLGFPMPAIEPAHCLSVARAGEGGVKQR